VGLLGRPWPDDAADALCLTCISQWLAMAEELRGKCDAWLTLQNAGTESEASSTTMAARVPMGARQGWVRLAHTEAAGAGCSLIAYTVLQ
jgi:hypothetical protein